MLQPVFMISGYFISVVGLAMLFPAFVDLYFLDKSWSPFITSSIITLFLGVSLFLSNQNKIKSISTKQAYLLTVVSWFAIAVVGALPFYISGATTSFVDAVFESTSGLTTTGATIMTDLAHTSKSILFWRALLSSIGGVGIVIFATALLPFLGIGGMAIFQRENSDINDKLMPKMSYIAKRIIFVYSLLVSGCFLSYYFAGMSLFDALCHAMTTVSTSGFANYDESFAYFKSVPIEVVAMVFMFLGSLPLTYYHSLLITKNTNNLRAIQVNFFIKILFVYIGVVTFWLVFKGIYSFGDALRYASFNIISLTSSTGYASTDYLLWGPFASVVFVAFALTGGCTGSTAGSIKIFRWQSLIAYLKHSFAVLNDQYRVVPIKIGTVNTSFDVINSVLVFLGAYFFIVIFLMVVVSFMGLDEVTAMGAVIACMTNSGPGIGNIVGPSGNYSSLSEPIKCVLTFTMLLGRLDVLTILIVFTKNFWKN